ncbi:thiamine-phosphate kinase [Bradyrhizobium sp. U87765 SZCCT0131]|uniref:thiamine-phosphate kinase n=1 Tax=unclassified Bradyrhizobium TaxID=2631580 RepID=UPI001BAAD0B5|nr:MULTISPECIES: thiamine-phosphate kinase [unclassified Bradyrhizobium]MBR1219938.1 thiamine-phosphate kinase [Bradyrhizobium sp. U87765 SZCCT0131]MBR1263606.1 thiamine-phosphate kinase [Bradyrhizobium sp. U87765 SZCCT0134]MBR1309175.1 thiamine-phosphate kinase [Bradyrhizobium sp. U87765 SZCCT0110]MBR1323938.1 thiamine-phosphate kinase [Bradyrhizobium sp. U87765 SZCCT0109]MBR1349490.1 thiamine-phosphate kinase [Bradyrhizobium sp. U87765 SZCCT0048]
MGAPAAGSGEDSLIARYFRPLATDPGAFNLVDDAAVLAAGGDDLVITTDAVVEGVHFLSDDPPDTIARKALRVNLSDLAAKGATPAGFVLTLALRQATDAWLAPFAAALGEDAAAFGCPVLGGDTVSTPGPLMISITVFGRVPRGTMVRRDRAQAGDRIFVSGTIGDAALGLDVLRDGKSAAALAADPAATAALAARYRVPQPRNVLAGAVRAHARAAMDVSDGLAGDLVKLCAASGVSAEIDVDTVPLSAAARAVLAAGAASRETILSGGDDYEILCTVPPDGSAAFAAAAAATGVAVTAIGTVRAGTAPPSFVDGQGTPVVLSRLSYSHF